MSVLAGLAWGVAALIAGLLGYALLSTAVLLFVHLPEGSPYTLLEDALLLLSLPFVVAVLGGRLLADGRL